MSPQRSSSNLSLPGLKRSQPFKPPGPARSSNPNASRSSDPAVEAVPSSPILDDDDDDEFGTIPDLGDIDGMDLDTADLTDAVSKTVAPVAPSRPPAQATKPRQPQPVTRPAAVPRPHAVISDDDGDESIPGVPAPLLARLQHEFFTDKSTAVSKAGNEMMRRYVDIYVREAVARSVALVQERIAAEKAKGTTVGDKGKSRGIEDDVWIDASDLEGVLPGLVMDF